jgi:hypothetical protein
MLNPVESKAVVPQGQTVEVPLEVIRTSNEKTKYKLTALSAPTGLSAADAELGATGGSATVNVTAASDAPLGAHTLALIAQLPIYPLFIVRTGYRRYRIVVREPIVLARTAQSRDEDIAAGVTRWCAVLERTIAEHWEQWFAFAPIFAHA